MAFSISRLSDSSFSGRPRYFWNSPSKTEMLVVRYRLFVTMLLLPTTLPVPLTVMGGGATAVGGTLGLEPPRLRSPENAVISASTIGKATRTTHQYFFG